MAGASSAKSIDVEAMADARTDLENRKLYPLSRDLHASARLLLQHLLWNIRLGHLLHPAITKAISRSPYNRIADVGTGNAIWPLELSRHLHHTTQFYGYDISAGMYPAKQWLPSNVHLGILDMLSDELPGDLRGTFDVVHVRAFACVIKGGDPTKVVKKMRDMLKPGGYLQWDEIDIGAYRARPADETISATACEKLVNYSLSYVNYNGFKSDWTKDLSKYFTRSGVEVLHATRLPEDPTVRKLETDDLLMVLEETLPDMAQQMALRNECTVGEAQDHLAKLLQGAVEETGRHVGLTMEWYSCVGRKIA